MKSIDHSTPADWSFIVCCLVPSLPEIRHQQQPAPEREAAAGTGPTHRNRADRRHHGTPVTVSLASPPSPAPPVTAIAAQLRDQLTTLIAHWAQSNAALSADLSGGVDSAAVAYLFAHSGRMPALYHQMPDSPANEDTIWARRIGRELAAPVTMLGTVAEYSRAFEARRPYPNGMTPERPVYWSDSEGYLEQLANSTDSAGVLADTGAAAGTPRIHITGLGGDELFAPLPASPWSCLREHPAHGWPIATRYRAARRCSRGQAFRELTDRTDLRDELAAAFRAAEQGTAHTVEASACGWHEAIVIPEFLTGKARDLLHDAVMRRLDRDGIQPLDPDRSRHQALYSLALQARTLHEINRMFAPNAIEFRSPYLDAEVMRCALAAPISTRYQNGLHKALLCRALRGIMPDPLFRRPTKGDHSRSLYLAWERSKDALLAALAGGALDEAGLIDVPRIRRMASMPMPDITVLFAMQRLAAVERWLTHAA